MDVILTVIFSFDKDTRSRHAWKKWSSCLPN